MTSTLRAIAEHDARPRLPRRDDAGARRHRGVPAAARSSPSTPACPSCCSRRSTVPEDKARGLEAGANDFLSKPFDAERAVAPGCARCCGRRRCRTGSPTCSAATSARASPPRCSAIRSSVSLGGDRRQVSTLFADVRGYTALAAEHPPETTLDLLNRYLTVVSDAVERHGAPSPTSWATASSPASAPP